MERTGKKRIQIFSCSGNASTSGLLILLSEQLSKLIYRREEDDGVSLEDWVLPGSGYRQATRTNPFGKTGVQNLTAHKPILAEIIFRRLAEI